MKNKRKAIFNATIELVSIHGFEGTSVAMIAEKAGVGIGTIYRYFNNKEDLFKNYFIEICQYVSSASLENYSEESPIYDRFRILWFNTMNYYLAHPQERSFTQQFLSSPYMNGEINDLIAEIFESSTRMYIFGVEQGIFKKMPRPMSDSFWWSTILELSRRHNAGEFILDDEMKELSLKIVWDIFSR